MRNNKVVPACSLLVSVFVPAKKTRRSVESHHARLKSERPSGNAEHYGFERTSGNHAETVSTRKELVERAKTDFGGMCRM
ncbi:MAG: hypothetical protein ACLT46_14665 [Hungatella sp.]